MMMYCFDTEIGNLLPSSLLICFSFFHLCLTVFPKRKKNCRGVIFLHFFCVFSFGNKVLKINRLLRVID